MSFIVISWRTAPTGYTADVLYEPETDTYMIWNFTTVRYDSMNRYEYERYIKGVAQ